MASQGPVSIERVICRQYVTHKVVVSSPDNGMWLHVINLLHNQNRQ
jgi:hypothetical protein